MDNKEMSVSPLVSVSVGVFGGLIFGYNTGIIATALDYIKDEFKIPKSDPNFEEVGVPSSLPLGAIIGAGIGGFFATLFGRRFALFVTVAFSFIGALVSAFSQKTWVLILFRGILGAGIGMIGVICPMYVSETAPITKRGYFVVFFQLSITIGILLAYILGYLLNLLANENYLEESLTWRLMLGSGIIFPICLGVITFLFVGETNYKDEVDTEHIQFSHGGTKIHGWRGLFSKQQRRPLVIGVILAITHQLTGINAVMYYAPDIIEKAGFTHTYILNMIIGAWNVATTFIAICLVERAGRRNLMIGGTALMTVSIIGVGAAFMTLSGNGDSDYYDRTNLSIVVGICLLLFIAGFEGGIGSLFWVLVNEVYPSHVKEAGSSFANILEWTFNLTVSSTFLYLLQSNNTAKVGWEISFFVFGGIGFLCTLYMYCCLNETTPKGTRDTTPLVV